ncbi:hypothetical protein C7212DRAFT_365406 [Tuber magnatum]|uniref:Uncharacterized protein n=1 Tax=Tuber magnatum TaxID=42249 RepID=A0A317SIW7_9PEZI|nr:hypothetical protein C7212DRAFT_365406 [Tuber magnatum]
MVGERGSCETNPPNWRLAAKIYQAIGRTLECLLDWADVATGITILSILALSISKQEMCIVPIIAFVGVFFHEWVLVCMLVIQLSFITLAMAGIVNFVLWKLLLKEFWAQVCHGRRAASLFFREAPDQIFGALAGWYGWCEIALAITRPLDWAGNVRLWVTYFCELPGICWKKWVSESWVLAWARILISYFGIKHREAVEEEDSKKVPEITTCIPETAVAPIKPMVIRSMHCTGSISTDYVDPYTTPSPPNHDLLLPESHPLPAAVVPDTPTIRRLRDQDPFRTPMPPRAGDPGFLNAYPAPEGGSKWQLGEKSFAEKEREKWKPARASGSMAPRVPVRNIKPSRGSEPGFLDAYPNPLPMPKKWLEDDFTENVERDENSVSEVVEVGSSNNHGEGNELHENDSNQLAIINAGGESVAESSADASRHEEGLETASNEVDSQETIELYAENRTIGLAVSAADGSDIELHYRYQSYFAQLQIVNTNRRDTPASPVTHTPPQLLAEAQAQNTDAAGTRTKTTRPAEEHPEVNQSQPGRKRTRY